jgi:hypothetical protein
MHLVQTLSLLFAKYPIENFSRLYFTKARDASHRAKKVQGLTCLSAAYAAAAAAVASCTVSEKGTHSVCKPAATAILTATRLAGNKGLDLAFSEAFDRDADLLSDGTNF